MNDAAQIKDALLNGPSVLGQKIARDIVDFTVCMVAVPEADSVENIKSGGTGTLVRVAESHFILTAAHVWKDALELSHVFSTPLKEAVETRLLINPDVIIPFGPPTSGTWGPWGPDLVLLRIPENFVSRMKVYGKCFYNLSKELIETPRQDNSAGWMLMGAPAEFGKFSQAHASLRLIGFFGVDQDYKSQGKFDYLDLPIKLQGTNIPTSFGGVSGGGLWDLVVTRNASTGEFTWTKSLTGVAFYQLDPESGQKAIRCHGPKSILAAMNLIT